jgi:flagellar protein FliJ
MAIRANDTLKMLQEIADKEVDLAAEALAEAMKMMTEAQSKYELLVSYRNDYHQNLNQSLETGIGAQAYQNFLGFFKKLDQAVKGQLEMVEIAKQHVQVQQQRWKESQRKKLSYAVLTQRNEHRHHKAMLKKDQLAMDEFAMRLSRQSK